MRDSESQDGNSNDREKDNLDKGQRAAFAQIAALVPKAASGQWTVTDRGCNGFHAGSYCPAGVPGSKLRCDHVANDSVRDDIGDLAFQSVADFNSKLAIVGHDNQRQPVVDAFSADSPCLDR